MREIGTAPTLTYSFNPGGAWELDASYTKDIDYLLGDGQANYLEDISLANSDLHVLEFLPSERQIVEDALADWSAVTGINFVENDLNINPYGDLHFTKLDFEAFYDATGFDFFDSYGFAFMPMGYDVLLGDVFLSFNQSEYVNISTVSHEIGHAIGLAHPHDGYLCRRRLLSF